MRGMWGLRWWRTGVRAAVGSALVVGALAGCGDDGTGVRSEDATASSSTSSSSTTSSTSGADGSTTTTTVVSWLDGAAIDAGGIGPIRAGMTVAEAEDAAGVTMTTSEVDTFGGRCYFADVDGMAERFSFLVVSPTDEPVTDPRDGIIGRVSVYDGMADPVTDDRGVGLDGTEDDVRAVYADLRIEESGHAYVDGLYLDIRPADRDDVVLRFETNEGEVTAIHGGLAEVARYVEGCA